MNFSAKQLVFRSASQLLYFYLNPKKNKPTKSQLEGEKYAKSIAESHLREMRGAYTVGSHTIYYAFDEVRNQTYLEVKQPGKYPEYFFRYSLLQLALYAAMTFKGQTLKSAKFTGESHIHKVKKNRQFILIYNKKKYEITVLKRKTLRQFFINKVNVIASLDYAQTKRFDKNTKFKYYQRLKHTFTFKRI